MVSGGDGWQRKGGGKCAIVSHESPRRADTWYGQDRAIQWVGFCETARSAPEPPWAFGVVCGALELIRAELRLGRSPAYLVVAIVGAWSSWSALFCSAARPGWLIVFAGLAIWAIEFHVGPTPAELHPAQVQGWTDGYGGAALAAAVAHRRRGSCFVACCRLAARVRSGFGIDLVAEVGVVVARERA